MPLQIIRQDITKMRVDAIVNTTNEALKRRDYIEELCAKAYQNWSKK